MLRPCEPVHLAGMARGKRNLEAIGRSIGKTVNGVRPEIMVISLLAVANYGEPMASKRAMVSRMAAS